MKKLKINFAHLLLPAVSLMLANCAKEPESITDTTLTGQSTINFAANATSAGLVAHYPLNGDAKDYSGNENHATINTATSDKDRFGKENGSYKFDGENQYIEIPDSDRLSISTTGKLSISVWMRPDALNFNTNSYIYWMGKGEHNQYEYAMRMYNKDITRVQDKDRPNRISCYAWNLKGNLGAGSYAQETVVAKEWLHFVAIYNFNEDTIQFYRNGVLMDTDSFEKDYHVTPRNGNAPFRIGIRSMNSYFNGAIDDIKIYDKVLSQDDITALYGEEPENTDDNQDDDQSDDQDDADDAGDTPVGPTAGLVAHYPFDGNGEDATDHNNHAAWVFANPAKDRFNKDNGSFHFDGKVQYIEIPDTDDLSIATTGELTISVWMNPDVLDFDNTEASGYVHWMGKGETGQHEYVFRMNNKNGNQPNRISSLVYNLSGGSGTSAYVQKTVVPNEWIHIVAVYNKNKDTVKLYRNGELEGTSTFSKYSVNPENGWFSLRVGTRDFKSYFKGSIDDLKIYNRALTNAEIASLYNE
ncbi:LamG domain-containing protein [Zobellia laminariae]|uniref:LamG domain-containing protein n=1 Tax=Zobellia laminariae TaxID=248906 RepID=UPI0026F40FD7|nr:LamG domain-containing protein [Zobellia laminariae]WKX76712.1 LamG domain-containing protein [Zobellia laminariae]